MLYHFSENPHIGSFVPIAPPDGENRPAYVWAIDGEHSVNYFFPRECPRVIYRKSAGVSEEDGLRFFGHGTAETVIAVESRWYESIRDATIYRYSFDDGPFEQSDGTAGYYVTRTTVEPMLVEPFGRLLDRIVESGAELRVTPSLYPLRDAIIASTVDDFSIIRFRNAK